MSDSHGDKRWPLAEVGALGQELTVLLSPYCERIMVAGSVRRRITVSPGGEK
mgnify:CR=1 FL=1